MRGYGIPQVCFATESFMDDIAYEIGMDPLEFRRKNLIHGYYEDAYLKPIACLLYTSRRKKGRTLYLGYIAHTQQIRRMI